MRVLHSVCQGPVTGVDFSTGMLAQAASAHPDATWVRADVRALPFADAFDLAISFGALGHFLPAERPALFAGIFRALRPGGVFAFPMGAPQPLNSGLYWALLGFDLAMRVRNAVWRPPFVMYYRTCPPARGPQRPDIIRIYRDHNPSDGARPAGRRQPAVPACSRAQNHDALTVGR
jgi:SAM-dependent methyltransferase